MRLADISYRCSDPERLARFYTDLLGMRRFEEPDGVRLGYRVDATHLVFRRTARDAPPYAHHMSDLYWKIGIVLPNVDMARAQLSAAGVAVSSPHQFLDIGYLCHLEDPEGFKIELLQRTFEKNRPARAGDPEQPLGSGADIGQVTLRVTAIDEALAYFQDRLGMKLLSIQPVDSLNFTLYFLAYTHENPPDPDLESVTNREWLWHRPYTTVELQHRLDTDGPMRQQAAGDAGYEGLTVRGATVLDRMQSTQGGKVVLKTQLGMG